MIDKLRQIFEPIIEFFKGTYIEENTEEKKEKSEYIVPLDERSIKYLNQWVQEELAAWRAKAAHLEEEVEKLRKELDKYKKKANLDELAEVAKMYKILRSIDDEDIYLLFKTSWDIVPRSWDGKIVIVRLKDEDGESLYFLRRIVGISVSYDPHNSSRLNLVCEAVSYSDPNKSSIVKIDLGPIENFPYMIRDFRNLYDQLLSGKIILNVDGSGRLLPYAISYRPGASVKSTENIVVLEEYDHIFKNYPELKDLIVDLYEKVNELRSENSNLKAEIEEWKDKYNRAFSELTALRKVIDINRLLTTKSMSELGESYKAIADVVGTNLQISTRLQALETSYYDLIDRHEELVKKYIDKVSELPDESSNILADKIADKIKEKIPLDVIEKGIRMAEERRKQREEQENE